MDHPKTEMAFRYIVVVIGVICSVVAAIMGNWLALSAFLSVVFLSVTLMCETLEKNFADRPNTNDFEEWWNAAGKSDARFLIFIGMRSRKYIAKTAWLACKKAHSAK